MYRVRIGSFLLMYYVSPRPGDRGLLDLVRTSVAAMTGSGIVSQDEFQHQVHHMCEMVGEILRLLAVSKQKNMYIVQEHRYLISYFNFVSLWPNKLTKLDNAS